MHKTIIVALAALAGSTLAEAAAVKMPQEAYRIVDGDTIRLTKSGNYVRALGFDTPEVRGQCQAEKDKAKQATDRLIELTSPPNALTLRYAKGQDRWGRSLAYFYAGGKPVGPILISEGLARPIGLSAIRRGKPGHNWCFQPSQQ